MRTERDHSGRGTHVGLRGTPVGLPRLSTGLTTPGENPDDVQEPDHVRKPAAPTTLGVPHREAPLRHRLAFPHALGTGIIIQSEDPVREAIRSRLAGLIEDFEATLSRFREDSPVGAMARATHGGTFEFPEWSSPLFDLTDRFVDLGGGRIDPCVGEDLMRLGYGADLTFHMTADAPEHLGSLHGRPIWRRDVIRSGTTLRTHAPVHLDFGLCGKGFLVDLIAMVLMDDDPERGFLVNAGGDIRAHVREPLSVGLEDPRDEESGVGIARLSSGALCASSPSRRHWRASATLDAHHLINALDGMPVTDVAATWTHVPAPNHVPDRTHVPDPTRAPDRDGDEPTTAYPTAKADGLATALFLLPMETLLPLLPFSCLTLSADLHATVGGDFPGTVFTS